MNAEERSEQGWTDLGYAITRKADAERRARKLNRESNRTQYEVDLQSRPPFRLIDGRHVTASPKWSLWCRRADGRPL